MKEWQIEYWTTPSGKSSIEKWLDALTKEQLKAVAKLIKMLEEAGNDLKLPHSRPLGDGLFELREMSYGYRIYYSFLGDMIIILLAAGKKQDQVHDMKIARKRLKEG